MSYHGYGDTPLIVTCHDPHATFDGSRGICVCDSGYKCVQWSAMGGCTACLLQTIEETKIDPHALARTVCEQTGNLWNPVDLLCVQRPPPEGEGTGTRLPDDEPVIPPPVLPEPSQVEPPLVGATFGAKVPGWVWAAGAALALVAVAVAVAPVGERV